MRESTQRAAGLLYGVQQPGDVILVKGGSGVIIGQKALAGKVASYSHVLICVARGLYMDSNPGQGVDYARVEDPRVDFPKVYARSWSVRRHELVSATETRAKITVLALHYYRQKYNRFIVLSRWFDKIFRTETTKTTSTCSELVAKIYSDLGIRDFGTSPHRVLPIHVDQATRGQRWSDITHEYERGFREEDPENAEFVEPARAVVISALDTLGAAQQAARHQQREIQSEVEHTEAWSKELLGRAAANGVLENLSTTFDDLFSAKRGAASSGGTKSRQEPPLTITAPGSKISEVTSCVGCGRALQVSSDLGAGLIRCPRCKIWWRWAPGA